MSGAAPPTGGRYARQEALPEVGPEGQARLGRSAALVVGAGALGCVAGSALVRAGVGLVRVVDRDVVELGNLHRQVLYDEGDVGEPKAAAAAERLQAANSSVRVEAVVRDVDARTVEGLVEGMGVVVDGTDNMEARFVLNDACVKRGVPWVYGAATGTLGMTLTVVPGDTACLRCCIPRLPPPGSLDTCERAGVLNALPMAIGAMEASEALKLLLGRGDLDRDLVVYDAWSRELRRVRAPRDPGCPCCGLGRFEHIEGARRGGSSVLCGRHTVQVTPEAELEVPLERLAERLRGAGGVRLSEHALTLSLPAHELVLFRDGRALVRGTDDPGVARSLYARYVGA